MGSFPSIQCRDERRRSNRLSKPPIGKSKPSSGSTSPSLPCPASNSVSPVLPGPAVWRDPWNETSIPIDPSDLESNAQRAQSLPSVTFQSEPRRLSSTVNSRSDSIVEEEDDQFFPSPGSSSNETSLTRKASFRPITLQGSLRSRPSLRQPKRSYSVHSSPRRTNSAIYESSLEEASSSNTHFMVDNQRFSLTRRRSLLTRPGVATRRSTQKTAQGASSPVDHEMKVPSKYPAEASIIAQRVDYGELLTPSPPFAQCARPSTSGSDLEYTHLGALKLGSLRVVNGSVSPCPSDRVPVDVPRSTTSELRVGCRPALTEAEEAEEAVVGMTRNRLSTSMLHIPALDSDPSKQDDVPGSPFSFEKSPTIAIPEEQLLFAEETGDEAIFMSEDEENMGSDQPEQVTLEGISEKRPLPSLSKADSGYSSATSIRSLRKTRSGSQRPRDLGACDNQAFFELSNKLALQRHLSLRGQNFDPRIRYSAFPESPEYPTGMSTMCHDMQQMQLDGRIRSASFATYPGSSCATSLHQAPSANFDFPATEKLFTQKRRIEGATNPPYRTQCPDVIRAPRHSKKSPSFEMGFDDRSYRNRAHTSASGSRSARKNFSVMAKERGSPISSKYPTGTRMKRLGIEIPSLPTFSIPEKAEDTPEGDVGNLGTDVPRGRTRSWSIERQHYPSKKLQKRSSAYKAPSPFIFH
ncbi:hypothetical protein ASPWEDRAFT_177889 [Aspergillus wentii DTO 134E9]|uniref:Uncharacterized protein n=1 Tax=Aspergillus wentii DTO 134E9 TaxID=1073089 RepID=A0A1L9R3S9_ASPWE|nr:uncharacterized protein ASPWEDRAFT_177889 [Aspergillus wentii DTO 134E9]OJJ29537.1 hypothetical protein ASPWEDRAFT_177889 [Aspergillus wentii DTO 134E9]